SSRDILAIEILVAGWAFVAWLITLVDVWAERALARWMWRIVSACAFAYFAFYCFQYKIETLLIDSLLDCILIAFFGALLFFISTLLCFACVLPTYLQIPEQR